MSILRKIIIKNWLAFFLASTLILLSILSLGNILSSLMSAKGGMSYILTKLSYEIPGYLVKILPVACLISSLFALNKLKNRNELTAIFASGFSRKKFIFTLASLGLLVGILLFFINAYIVPRAVHQTIIELKENGNSSVTTNVINSGRVWFKGQNYFVSYSSFDSNKNRLNDLHLYYYDSNFKINEEIKASTATFLKDKEWNLENVVHIKNLENKTFPSSMEHKSLVWALDENIQDFKKINADISTLSIWKLYDYIQVLNSNSLNSNEYYVSFLDKFASGFTCLILSLLSAVAVFNPNRRNSSFGLNVSFVLGFTFLYWFIYSYFITLGQTSRIHPLIATFGVPGVFAIYLTFFFLYHRKLR